MSRNTRRPISAWTSQQIAHQNYECDQCGHPITAEMMYERKVFTVGGKISNRTGGRYKDKLQVERTHIVPDCWINERWHP